MGEAKKGEIDKGSGEGMNGTLIWASTALEFYSSQEFSTTKIADLIRLFGEARDRSPKQSSTVNLGRF